MPTITIETIFLLSAGGLHVQIRGIDLTAPAPLVGMVRLPAIRPTADVVALGRPLPRG